MTSEAARDEATWPRTCPHCGTEQQSHTTGFCPNPDCPGREENAPGSLGGDNGGG